MHRHGDHKYRPLNIIKVTKTPLTTINGYISRNQPREEDFTMVSGCQTKKRSVVNLPQLEIEFLGGV